MRIPEGPSDLLWLEGLAPNLPRLLAANCRTMADEKIVVEFRHTLVKRWLRILLLFLSLTAMPVRTQQSGQSTLQLRVPPECSITGSTSTLSGPADGGALMGATTFSYKLRTSSEGGASIQLKLAQPGAQFSYVVRLPGAAESSGSQTIPKSSTITVAQFGPNAHSAKQGDTGTMNWSLKGATNAGTPQIALTIQCN